MSESNGRGAAIAAMRIHERYGLDFSRRLRAVLSRLDELETGEGFSLSVAAPGAAWLDPGEYPPGDVDGWSTPTGWELAGAGAQRYQQRQISRGPRKGQSGWYDSEGKKFMPADWRPAAGREPKGGPPAKGKGEPAAGPKAAKAAKPTVDDVHAAVTAAGRSGKPATKEDVQALGAAIGALTDAQVKELRGRLGMTKGGAKGDRKAERVKGVVDRIAAEAAKGAGGRGGGGAGKPPAKAEPAEPAAHAALPDDHPVSRALSSLGVELTPELLADPDALAGAIRAAASPKPRPNREPRPRADAPPHVAAKAGEVRAARDGFLPRLAALHGRRDAPEQLAAMQGEAEEKLRSMRLDAMTAGDLASLARSLGAHHAGLRTRGDLIDAVRHVVMGPIATQLGGAG